MIVVDSIDKYIEVLKNLKEKGFVIENTINEFGYRGINATIRIGDVGGEIQVHTRESKGLKDITDLIYRDWRDYTDKDVETFDEKTRLDFEAAVRESVKTWADYWEESVPQKSITDNINLLKSQKESTIDRQISEPVVNL